MGWTYGHTLCDLCGEEITFITLPQGPVPIHPSGFCPGRTGGWYNYGTGQSLRITSEGERFEFPFVTATSYVVPNAHCPVCERPVYFYESPNGERVFLEELGPPWTKHAHGDESWVRRLCASVEGRARFLVQDISKPELAPMVESAWAKEGWMPFIIKEVVTRRIGVEAKGELHQRAGAPPLKLRVWQESTEAEVWRREGVLTLGFNLVMNPGMVLGAFYECPVLVRRRTPDAGLDLSSFVIQAGEVAPVGTWVEMEEAGS